MFDLNTLKDQLIVSCQPEADEAFYDRHFVLGMATAAQMGGAGGLRLNHPDNIRYIKQHLDLPVIGIWKQVHPGSDVYITPTLESALALVEAGADLIALDATPRQRPAEELATIVSTLKNKGVCLMADVSTFEEAQEAQEMGFDCVAPTLSGYTPYSPQSPEADFELLRQLSQSLAIPVIMEGKIASPAQARQALDCGAHAVVVGSAITRPQVITRHFIQALKNSP